MTRYSIEMVLTADADAQDAIKAATADLRRAEIPVARVGLAELVDLDARPNHDSSFWAVTFFTDGPIKCDPATLEDLCIELEASN